MQQTLEFLDLKSISRFQTVKSITHRRTQNLVEGQLHRNMMQMLLLLEENLWIKRRWVLTQLWRSQILKLRRCHQGIHLVFSGFSFLVLWSVIGAVRVMNLLSYRWVKMACSTAVCVKLRLVGVLEVSSFSFIFELFSRVHKYTAPWLKCIVWHPQELWF
jgi:hypothetical protein